MSAKVPTSNATWKRKYAIISKGATSVWRYCQILRHRRAQMAINSTKIPSNVTVSGQRSVENMKIEIRSWHSSFVTADVNECETKLGLRTCGSNKECVNTPGGYDCVDNKTAKKVTTKWVKQLRNSSECIRLICWTVFRPRFSTESITRKPLTCTKGYQQQGDQCVGESIVVVVLFAWL